MSLVAQLFTGTHAEALARATALDAGDEPDDATSSMDVSLTPVDLEVLGEIAAKAVRFGSGDLEVAEVDLEHEYLFKLPEYLCEVLAALDDPEDPDAPADVAEAWAASEEMDAAGQDLQPLVREITGLVARAVESGQDVYLWLEPS
ncbi:hypothetical protein ICW40_17215 [Actinotalea ferrariae]|uniref:hypothetical protein n=1 Tax=Actinotalea ferrariae TaxID=1386098 RepID=UPI001C8B7FC3|nr:hypothetical protein [Actinotalea ferrariae]MBX9246534.1 hypothetical protein [Actinotalea ferrariae]